MQASAEGWVRFLSSSGNSRHSSASFWVQNISATCFLGSQAVNSRLWEISEREIKFKAKSRGGDGVTVFLFRKIGENHEN